MIEQPHIPAHIPEEMQEALAEVLLDRNAFFSMLKIQDKASKELIPFVPNDAQNAFLDLIEIHKRVIVVKARQVGISTAARAYQMWKAYTAKQPHKYAVLSFHERSAKNLRRIDKLWLKRLPQLLHRKMSLDSSTDAEYADTGAGVSSYTTGGRGGTRSFAFSSAHLSEFAYYLDADETLAEVVATVGATGSIIIESTVNAVDDAYARLVREAPQNGWYIYTYWWWQYPEHRIEAPDDFVETEEEAQLAELYDLSVDQLQWRREMIATLTEKKFRREYPACMDDAFAAKESLYFSAEALTDIQAVHFPPDTAAVLEKVNPDDYYVIGADPAGGTGGDYSAMQVVSCATLQPVFSWRSNKAAPHEFAAKLVEVGARYTTNNGRPLLLVESQNHGHAVLRELYHLNYKPLWGDDNGKPWVTVHKSKIDAYDGLRELIDGGMIAQLDAATLLELRSIQILKVSPEAPPGLHDDLAMALALAYRAYRDAPASKKRQGREKAMEAMISSVRARKTRSKALPWARN